MTKFECTNCKFPSCNNLNKHWGFLVNTGLKNKQDNTLQVKNSFPNRLQEGGYFGKIHHMKIFLSSVVSSHLWEPTTTDVMCRWHMPRLTNIFCLSCSSFCITISSGFSCSPFFFWSLPCHCNLLHHLCLSLHSQLFNLDLKIVTFYSEFNKHVKWKTVIPIEQCMTQPL